jgi:hypothetical protein
MATGLAVCPLGGAVLRYRNPIGRLMATYHTDIQEALMGDNILRDLEVKPDDYPEATYVGVLFDGQGGLALMLEERAGTHVVRIDDIQAGILADILKAVNG